VRFFSLETFLLGIRNLRLHKLRSLLTSLGIIFGVAAVICMLSVSEGASADELRMLRALGTRNIIVNAIKPEQSTQVSQGNTNLVRFGIADTDLSIIKASIPHIDHIVPLKVAAHGVRYGENQSPSKVVAVSPDFFDVVNISVAKGRPLCDTDMSPDSNVCVIGADVRRELFQLEEPMGATIMAVRAPLSAVPFTVVGVLQEVQTAGTPARGVEERNLNREVLVPLAAAKAQFGAITLKQTAGSRELTEVEYSGLYVAADTEEHVLPVSEMIKRVFKHNHTVQDYEVRVPLARLELAKQKKRNNQKILGLIASISLLVGGIGIMNIMLASVTERTREIGIRRALGARQAHIRAQFLVETVVLSTAGGVTGVLLGFAGSTMLSRWAEWQPIISLWSVLLSFSLSVLIGVLSGLYPAISAAKLDPIEALRYE